MQKIKNKNISDFLYYPGIQYFINLTVVNVM